jgi:hypothetical protein
MKRLRARSWLEAVVPFSFTLLAACSPGSSEHLTPTDDGGTQMEQLPACSLGTSMADIEAKLFRGIKCSICHMLTPSGQHPLYPTNLEFTTPNLAARMVDQPSEADPMKGKCAGRILVPKDDPLGGLFVEKVTHPTCGDRMPQAMPPLNDDNVNCVKRWAILAAQSVK